MAVRRRGLSGGLALAWLLGPGARLAAQAEGTLDVGASVVKYDGFLTSGAFVLAPAVRFETSRWALAGRAGITVFESGREVLQGNLAAAWLAGSRGPWRLELSGSAGASEYATQPLAGHVLAGARLHLLEAERGAWIGASSGRTFGDPDGSPLELVVAGWTIMRRLAVVGTATASWLGGARQLDLIGAARWMGPRLELEARGGVRPWARDPATLEPFSGAYGEVAAVLRLGRWLSASVGGGRDPADPVRGYLGASYLSIGFRVRLPGRAALAIPLHTTNALRGRSVPAEQSGPRLEIGGSGEDRMLRVRTRGARMVELMGDFTDWVPIRLEQIGSGSWEIRLPVPPGVYRVNVRINGGTWSVPRGTRLERTEFGGAVGIVVFPD